MKYFNLEATDTTWQPIILKALKQINEHYIHELQSLPFWLPGKDNIFNAFSLPLNNTNYVLVGESPYPRAQSANGYAFWDAAVKNLWSPQGLDKLVNRATSLRNIIKMLLIAENLLKAGELSQLNIASIAKDNLVQTNTELFSNLLKHGFLLLNCSLVWHSAESVKYHATKWLPFINVILNELYQARPNCQLILFGKVANLLQQFPVVSKFKGLTSEHPFNISFVTNPKVIKFFKPFHLLRAQ